MEPPGASRRLQRLDGRVGWQAGRAGRANGSVLRATYIAIWLANSAPLLFFGSLGG